MQSSIYSNFNGRNQFLKNYKSQANFMPDLELKGNKPKVFNRDFQIALNSPNFKQSRSKGKIEINIHRNTETTSKISKATEPLKDCD